MDFYFYIVFAIVYLGVIYFAIGVKKEFNLFLMTFGFVFGGAIGWWFKSWEVGMVVGVILSLIFY